MAPSHRTGLSDPIARSVLLPGAQSDQERTFVLVSSVGTGYFQTLSIPIEQGRPFERTDRADAQPVVIVNRPMADAFWPSTSARGQTFSFLGGEPIVIVEIAYAYLPLEQAYSTALALVARTSGDPDRVLASVERMSSSVASADLVERPQLDWRIVPIQAGGPTCFSRRGSRGPMLESA